MTSDDDRKTALVRRWWDEVWGAGHLDLIPELTTDPFVRHSQAGSVRRTHAELREDMAQYRRVLNACVTDFQTQMVHGDRVFTRLVATGMNLETAEPVVVHWLQEHRIENERLAETWALYTFTPGWSDTP